MAKKSAVAKNNNRKKLAQKFASKRERLKAIAQNKELSMEERFDASLRLAELPRNSAPNRVRNRCEVSGRPRGILSQTAYVADCTERIGFGRQDSGHGEIELVRIETKMAVTDPIGDLLTRIRNAQLRGRSKVLTPGSRLRERVLDVLQDEGFIRGYSVTEQTGKGTEIEIELKYFEGRPVIQQIKRVSKPGRRVYSAVKDLPRVRNGLGIAIVSTPKGVMSDAAARSENVGGEVLAHVF